MGKLSSELEIEYKSMLRDEEQFKFLKEYFEKASAESNTYVQYNFYLESKDWLLLKNKVTMRIREKGGNWEITIKTKSQGKKHSSAVYSAKVETNMTITPKEAFDVIKGKPITMEHPIVQKLSESVPLSEDVEFFYIGCLQTERTDYKIGNDIVSLDLSKYNNIVDYEIEWETKTNHSFVRSEFEKLGLDPGNASGKRKRFLKSLRMKQ